MGRLTLKVAERTVRVVLVGLRGVGKSAVGHALAQRLGIPFTDSDQQILENTGRSAAEWIRQEGEARFREVEAALVEQLAALPGPLVIALGGGAPTQFSVREALRDWHVICLDAPDKLLEQRIREDREAGFDRPALTNLSVAEEIGLQRRERWTDYMSMSPRVVNVTADPPSPEQLAEQIAQVLPSN